MKWKCPESVKNIEDFTSKVSQKDVKTRRWKDDSETQRTMQNFSMNFMFKIMNTAAVSSWQTHLTDSDTYVDTECGYKFESAETVK